MPTISQMYELVDKLDPQNRTAIIALIDIKAEEQMESVTAKLDMVLSKIDSVNARIDGLDAKVDSLEKVFNTKFDSIEKRLSFLQWCMITGFSAIALVVTVLKLAP